METYNHALGNESSKQTNQSEALPGSNNSEISHDLREFFPSKFARILGRQAVKLIQNGHVANNEDLSLAPEFRADLENFNDPEIHKNAERDRLNQNVIFTHFVKHSGEKGREILQLISPEEEYLKFTNSEIDEFAEHYDDFKGTESYYDFISALTAKDESGEYRVSDEKLNKFTGWYLSEANKLEKKFNENIPEIEKYYAGAMKRATENGYLPDICNVLAERLNATPSLHQDIEYTLFDRTHTTNNGASPNGATSKLKNSDTFLISIAIDEFYSHPTQHLGDSKGKAAFYVINHELTHALEELRPMRFKSDDANLFLGASESTITSANRIFKEAITEDIGGIISNVHDNATPSSIKPFCENGRSYPSERETLRFLQSGGQAEISPDLFYEAYVDSRVSWSKLKRELKASFPECKTDSDLADFIVNNYNKIKEKNS
ncbi:hypothetical protein J6D24_02585 [Candidatus Saccharibacteria bacterium]|nr:hypothetical protein [Candidatus Saccharibacteria bacterium]